ncbi:MAG: tyrosine-type recombinase/integrase [Myxococcales bacterium]|nr:tyrosine-type recombinase/integrase [Myxococcales bacterium]
MPGLRSITDITLERLQAYFASKRARVWTADTYSNQYRALKAFLDWCVQRGHLDANPLHAIPRPKLEKKLPKGLTAEEAELVLNYAFYGRAGSAFMRHRNRALLAVMLHAGLRLAETMNLEVGHIDLASRCLFVKCGKGGKDRLVPIGGTLAGYLEKYLAQRTKAGKRCRHLFTTVPDDRRLAPHTLQLLIRKIRKATGVDVSAHRLRHTFATLMLEGGCDLFSLKEMMGHSRIETTMGYLSATIGHLRGQMSKHPLETARNRGQASFSPSPFYPEGFSSTPRFPSSYLS